MERRIVVSGYYGSKNAGDEAMLAAMLEVLGDLDPKLHITVISASPADTSARHGVESVSWLSLPSIIKALWRADLLIIGGTSLMVYPAAGLCDYFGGRDIVVINLSETARETGASLTIRRPIGEVMRELMERIR